VAAADSRNKQRGPARCSLASEVTGQ